MGHHISLLIVVGLSSACLAACDRPGVAEQQKESKATEQAANAKSEAERQEQAAQANAERDIEHARAEFEKAREDYLHARRLDLDELDKREADLEAKAMTSVGKAKANLEARLPAIRAQRDTYARHLQALATTTTVSWDSAKASLDKEWDALNAAVDHPK